AKIGPSAAMRPHSRAAVEHRSGSTSLSSRVALVLGLIALFADTANAACRLIGTSIGTSHVRAVEDGRTMVLADGRTVRLAGIEVAADDSAARMALASLVLGNDVELWQLGP